MNTKYLMFALLFLVFAAGPLAAASSVVAASAEENLWLLSPASASDQVTDAQNARFVPIENLRDGEPFLVSDEGWFWLKKDFQRDKSNQALLIGGAALYWRVWVDNVSVAQGGSAPPWWFGSSPFPELIPLDFGSTINTESATAKINGISEDSILIKVYYRKGYAGWNGPLEIGDSRILNSRRILYLLRDVGLPLLTIAVALILALTAFSLFLRTKRAAEYSLTIFSLFLVLTQIPAIAALFPSLSGYISWSVPVAIAAGAMPLALSSWRRSIACSGGKREAIAVSLADRLISLIVAAWALLPLLGISIFPASEGQQAKVPLQLYYTLAVLIAAVTAWIINVAKRRTQSWYYLLPLAATLCFFVAGFVKYKEIPAAVNLTLDYGIPSFLLLSIPMLVLTGKASENPSAPPRTRVNMETTDEDFDDLEELEAVDSVTSGALTRATDPRSGDSKRDKRLTRGIQSALYPDVLPKDSHWDVASVHAGSKATASGFHDVYQSDNRKLIGFAVMDAGSSGLESAIVMQLVKTKLSEYFKKETGLGQILRAVHRHLIYGLPGSGKTLNGTLGRIQGNRLSYISLGDSPILLRRTGDTQVLLLKSSDVSKRNQSLGSTAFEKTGLKSLGLRLESGDVLLVCDKRQLSTGIARAFGKSRAVSASGIAADITGQNASEALNLLVIRRIPDLESR